MNKALAMWSVIRYHHQLRSGISWKINKHIVELWHSFVSDSDDSTSTTLSFYIDENENRLAYPTAVLLSSSSSSSSSTAIDTHAYQSTVHTDDSELDDLKRDDEKMLGDGSDEDDSLLVIAYQGSNAI